MFERIKAAAERLKGKANETPVMTSRTLSRMAGAEVFLKCENFQRAGAFKFRGAYNAMSQLTVEEKKRGVVTHSSGNHAQAVALVGKLLGIKTIIVMPNDAPATKRAATEEYGAEIVEYDPNMAKREEISQKLAEAHGYVLIPPFDHPEVIAGQGTAALELFNEVGALDYLLVPCGGGGLLSGSAIAAKNLSPACRVMGIEPELADDATRSFRTKQLQTVHNPPTIADGTRTSSLGRFTFPLVLQYVDDMQTVSEMAILEAVRFLFYRTKLVVEPSGALGIAALLSGAAKPQGRAGVILSGGNLDAETMISILNKKTQ
jgi:threonine dehydratase